jgi:hypothetical protein
VPEPLAIRWTTVFLDYPGDVHPAGEAFWAAVTGSTRSARRGDRDQFATLLPPDGDPYLRVQRLDGAPRVHLDLHVDAVGPATEVAVALGARVLLAAEHTVLAAPGGFVFCLVTAHREQRRPGPVRGARGGRCRPDQLALDVPASLVDLEREFFVALTGWAPDADPAGTLVPLVRGVGMPVRLMVQRLGPDDPRTTTTGHLDLAAGGPDRRTVVAEHVDLGATVLAVHDRWTVLRDPAGLVYCLTDRDPDTGRLPVGRA